jgi:Flp pilus assembly protein TadG
LIRSVDDAGASTVEAALAITALVFVLVLCVAGISAVSMQVRCVDAAREAARLAARGDERSAVDVARRVAPGGAQVRLHRDGDIIVATVSVRPTLLSALVISSTEVSAAEPRR